ncbi:MAG: TRAP transporter permease, partial [Deferribacterales bacterium]
ALLSAHLLIFWYSQDANVTPPVALVAYAAVGLLILAIFFEGYFLRPINWLERVLYAIAGVLMIWPEKISNYIGFVIFGILTTYIYISNKKSKQALSNC